MKYTIILFCFFYVQFTHAQTNTFPSTGNVGVGTTSPANAKIEVNGDNSSRVFFAQGGATFPAANSLFRLDARGNTVFDMKGNGYTGIGTASPNSKLVISDNDANGFEINPVSGRGGGTNLFSYNRSNSSYTPLLLTGNSITLATAGANDVVTVANSGNVGINQSSPSNARLEVNGDNSSRVFYAQGGAAFPSANSLFRLDAQQNVALDIKGNGYVGIGTAQPTEKLSVNGNITAKKIKVTQLGWSDYVFNDDYELLNLYSLENYIKQNRHLPDVPSANEVEKNGISVGDAQALLLKKVEELTLYIIDQQKQIDTLKRLLEKKDAGEKKEK